MFISYNLQKRAVISQFSRNEIAIEEICDAQQELLRAATFRGKRVFIACPVCTLLDKWDMFHRVPSFYSFEDTPSPPLETLREVVYLYGDELRQKQGHLVESSVDLTNYANRFESFWAWTVEVCIRCRWNHPVKRKQYGTSHAN